jgi:predicted RNase H-like HicB family nuclease
MKYHFKVAKDENGYTARCIELFGCYASGYNKKSLHRNMKEALDSYIEKGELCPLPNQDLYGYEEIEPDQALAMGLLLRHARKTSGLSTREMSSKLGLRSEKTYRRMEIKTRATHEKLNKLQRLFPDFDFLRLVI